MAQIIRNRDPSVAELAAAHNATRKEAIGALGRFHYDAAEQPVSAADATDLASSIALANQIQAVYEGRIGTSSWPGHRKDLLAHDAVDATNVVESALATTLATTIALANEEKLDINAHLTQASVHPNNDGTNTITANNAGARGTLTFDTVANHGLADTYTINDGVNPAVVFELDKAGDGVAGTNVQVDISTDTTAAEVAARFKTALDVVIAAEELDLSTNIVGATITVVALAPAVNITLSETSAAGAAAVTTTTAQASLNTLLTEIKAKLNAHMADALAGYSLRVIGV